MLLFTPVPVPPDELAKIAVRMTGHGDLRLWAVGPEAERLEPEGVTPHTGSNWERPGDEWGSYWKFPSRGCWTVHAERREVSGTTKIMVDA